MRGGDNEIPNARVKCEVGRGAGVDYFEWGAKASRIRSWERYGRIDLDQRQDGSCPCHSSPPW